MTPAPLDPERDTRLESMREDEARKLRRKRLVMLERLILLPLLGLALLGFFTLGRVQVSGKSMEPTLHDGERLLVWKAFQVALPLQVGDIVVLRPWKARFNDLDLIKRIVFMQNDAGDRRFPAVIETPRGPVASEMLFPEYARGEQRVPRRALLVLGDNTTNSTDSRDFGPVRPEEIFGKVILR